MFFLFFFFLEYSTRLSNVNKFQNIRRQSAELCFFRFNVTIVDRLTIEYEARFPFPSRETKYYFTHLLIDRTVRRREVPSRFKYHPLFRSLCTPTASGPLTVKEKRRRGVVFVVAGLFSAEAEKIERKNRDRFQ